MGFHRNKTVKTKKEQLCKGCLLKIPSGSVADNFAGSLNGEFYHGYLCVSCSDYLDKNSRYFYDGWYPGDIGLAIKESVVQCV